jgi:hypothetical protein
MECVEPVGEARMAPAYSEELDRPVEDNDFRAARDRLLDRSLRERG